MPNGHMKGLSPFQALFFRNWRGRDLHNRTLRLSILYYQYCEQAHLVQCLSMPAKYFFWMALNSCFFWLWCVNQRRIRRAIGKDKTYCLANLTSAIKVRTNDGSLASLALKSLDHRLKLPPLHKRKNNSFASSLVHPVVSIKLRSLSSRPLLVSPYDLIDGKSTRFDNGQRARKSLMWQLVISIS